MSVVVEVDIGKRQFSTAMSQSFKFGSTQMSSFVKRGEWALRETSFEARHCSERPTVFVIHQLFKNT